MSKVDEIVNKANSKMKSPLISGIEDIGNVDRDYYKHVTEKANAMKEVANGAKELTRTMDSINNMYDSKEVVYKIKKQFPRMMDDYEDIVNGMMQLFCKKQDDYGPSNIGLGKSTLENKEDIKHSTTGLIIRMSDKIHRLLHLDKENKNPNNESIDDTLTDIANYCVMAQMVRRGNWGK